MATGQIITFPSESEIEGQIQEAGERAGISPFDPDFLLVLLFAMIVDAADVVLFIASFFGFGIPKLIGIIIDIIVFATIMGWIWWRVGEINKSKEVKRKEIQASLEKSRNRLLKLQKLGEVDPKVFERYMRIYSRQMERLGRITARLIRRAFSRALVRVGIAVIGEIIIVLGLIPFWTITVILTLREK